MISAMDSSAPARPTSGWAPAPRPSVVAAPSWMRRSALDWLRAWASVLATTKSTPSRPASIMLLTALPPAPPTPKTVMRGRSSLGGYLQVDRHIRFSSVTSLCHLVHTRIAQLIRVYIVESFQPPAGQPAEPGFALARGGYSGQFRIQNFRRQQRAGHQKADGGGIVRPGRSGGQARERLGPAN